MPGRSLDTGGLCVTSFGVTEIPHFTWVKPGNLSSSGGGGAVAYGQDTLINQTNGGVAASGIGGGLSYVISGITAYSIQLAAYFSAISGTATITAWKGTNTGTTGIQLGSTTTGVTSPAISLNVVPFGNLTTPATITVTITMANGAPRSLFTIDSLGYTKRYDIAVTSVATRCGSPIDRYEFGFNGQMKSNEIAGVGNHNTALFWEYDTRVGRRWNLDPKPMVGLSYYSVFGDNPIINNDVLGDIINVTVLEKIDNMPTPVVLKYDYTEMGGYGFYRPDGTKYEGSNEFVQRLHTGLARLSLGTEGFKLVTSLRTDPRAIEIMPGGRNAAFQGYITWNPLHYGNSGYDQNGNTLTYPWIKLGHELGHASNLLGGHNGKTWVPTELDEGKISYDEIRASHIENKIRAENGLPLRTHYAIEDSYNEEGRKTNRPLESTRLIKEGTNESKHVSDKELINFGGLNGQQSSYKYK